MYSVVETVDWCGAVWDFIVCILYFEVGGLNVEFGIICYCVVRRNGGCLDL